MKRLRFFFYLIFCVSLFVGSSSFSQSSVRVTGYVKDAVSGELLAGSSVGVFRAADRKEQASVLVGLNGSFSLALPDGKYIVAARFVGYKTLEKELVVTSASRQYSLDFSLLVDQVNLAGVSVSAQRNGTDAHARYLEKLSPSILNVVSARQIQLSPDITVANVIQRVSGLSIERNASGDPQYAIVRGMDKRYNNTLINGIKIPSPDNENRFVPLDIFPAVFLERLEVYKSLTASMEADAIGGSVNMVMKSAPSTALLAGDVQLGYNQMNFERDFSTYDRSRVNKLSPKEMYGRNYRATPADFPVENMIIEKKRVLPDVFANLSYGDRFLKDKLGVMLGGSFQNSYRPVSNYFYNPSVSSAEGNPLLMRELIERETSSQLQRIALHGKFDYKINQRHSIGLYAGKYLLNEFRVRDQRRRISFVTSNDYPVYPITRTSNIYQDISTVDLRGDHHFSEALSMDWSAVYSIAKNDRPDDGVFARAGQFETASQSVTNEIVYFQDTRNSRTWERNQDDDRSVYLNILYKPEWISLLKDIRFGGLGRNKVRDNYYNYYNYDQIFGQYRGVDWDDFGDVRFVGMANPQGSGDRSNLVYDAHENTAAAYLNTRWETGRTEIQAGVRTEFTSQGYAINALSASSNDIDLTKEQNYHHFFPSASVRHKLNEHTNLKATYFKGISRPGFYEIVPTVRRSGGGDSFYSEMGNADLKPSIGHSVDFRYEYFPSSVDQILVGAFFKQIKDPIEYGFPRIAEAGTAPVLNRILPQNFDDATNSGLEADVTKYFNRIGIRMNYTYTHSAITTNKVILDRDGNPQLVSQTRPLQGQSAHVGNISLLWKDQKNKLDAQIVLNYTGERIAVVSPYLGADHYMRPMTQLDLSVEKGIGRLVLFVKANNLLNTPYQLFVNKPLAVPEDPYPYQEDPYNKGYVRRDLYGQSYRLGVRFNFKTFITKN